jgi:hypothetical protein
LIKLSKPEADNLRETQARIVNSLQEKQAEIDDLLRQLSEIDKVLTIAGMEVTTYLRSGALLTTGRGPRGKRRMGPYYIRNQFIKDFPK